MATVRREIRPTVLVKLLTLRARLPGTEEFRRRGLRIARSVKIAGLLLLFLLFAPILPIVSVHGGAAEAPGQGVTPQYQYRVVRNLPHDTRAFTQGLVYDEGFFFEGTGLYGLSSLRKVEAASGRVVKEIKLERAYFGEGITIIGKRIVQITWQSRVGFVYDKKSFVLLKRFSYPHEGWGITYDGKRLIMSDGTSILHVLDPSNFRETATIQVTDGQGPVGGLNELEYVRGSIYANVWPTNRIVLINPETGRLTAWLDLKGLLDRSAAAGVDVLNGIAYDAQGDRLFVTGKLWPKVFELKIIKHP